MMLYGDYLRFTFSYDLKVIICHSQVTATFDGRPSRAFPITLWLMYGSFYIVIIGFNIMHAMGN